MCHCFEAQKKKNMIMPSDVLASKNHALKWPIDIKIIYIIFVAPKL